MKKRKLNCVLAWGILVISLYITAYFLLLNEQYYNWMSFDTNWGGSFIEFEQGPLQYKIIELLILTFSWGYVVSEMVIPLCEYIDKSTRGIRYIIVCGVLFATRTFFSSFFILEFFSGLKNPVWINTYEYIAFIQFMSQIIVMGIVLFRFYKKYRFIDIRKRDLGKVLIWIIAAVIYGLAKPFIPLDDTYRAYFLRDFVFILICIIAKCCTKKWDDIRDIKDAFNAAYIKAKEEKDKFAEEKPQKEYNKSIVIKDDIDVAKSTKLQQSIETKDYIFCRKCGNKLPSDSQFCNKCGTQVINV